MPKKQVKRKEPCLIKVDLADHEAYFGGDEVNGTVFAVADSRENILSMRVELIGLATTVKHEPKKTKNAVFNVDGLLGSPEALSRQKKGTPNAYTGLLKSYKSSKKVHIHELLYDSRTFVPKEESEGSDNSGKSEGASDGTAETTPEPGIDVDGPTSSPSGSSNTKGSTINTNTGGPSKVGSPKTSSKPPRITDLEEEFSFSIPKLAQCTSPFQTRKGLSTTLTDLPSYRKDYGKCLREEHKPYKLALPPTFYASNNGGNGLFDNKYEASVEYYLLVTVNLEGEPPVQKKHPICIYSHDVKLGAYNLNEEVNKTQTFRLKRYTEVTVDVERSHVHRNRTIQKNKLVAENNDIPTFVLTFRADVVDFTPDIRLTIDCDTPNSYFITERINNNVEPHVIETVSNGLGVIYITNSTVKLIEHTHFFSNDEANAESVALNYRAHSKSETILHRYKKPVKVDLMDAEHGYNLNDYYSNIQIPQAMIPTFETCDILHTYDLELELTIADHPYRAHLGEARKFVLHDVHLKA